MQSYNCRSTTTYLRCTKFFAPILRFRIPVEVLTANLCSYESRIVDFASVSKSLVMRKKAGLNER